MKTEIEYFRDWESSMFGYGYGSGEEHIIPAVHKFLSSCRNGTGAQYDYRDIENELGALVAWLLINTFCKAGLLEYGTSPRFAWLEPEGVRLRDFMTRHTPEQLLEFLDYDENYIACYPDYCNCEDEKCNNPFWKAKK